MNRITICLIPLMIVMFGCNEEPTTESPTYETIGSIEVMDERLNDVLNVDARPEIIGEGFSWSEGPVWVEEHGFLLFSDVPENTIFKWTEEDGITEYLSPSGYSGDSERGGEIGSNGLIISNDGRLILCQHGDRRIVEMDAPLDQPQPEFITKADHYEGGRFNSPNDVIQHSDGSIYFTDPPYGLEGYVDDPLRELDFQGVYRIDPDGEVQLLTDELTRPNGLAFSQDESLLYVANSDGSRALWMVYDVREDGGIENGRIFYDATDHVGDAPGMPDGMKVNSEGTLFATGPGGLWIFSPDGTPLGRVETGEFISNGAFNADESVFYMTADSYILRLHL